jgi:hypothetical protein
VVPQQPIPQGVHHSLVISSSAVNLPPVDLGKRIVPTPTPKLSSKGPLPPMATDQVGFYNSQK